MVSFMKEFPGNRTPILCLLGTPCLFRCRSPLQPEGKDAGPGSERGWTWNHPTGEKRGKNPSVWRYFYWINNVENVPHVRVDSQEGVSFGEELLLQGDDDDLHVLSGLLSDEARHLEANHNTVFKLKKNLLPTNVSAAEAQQPAGCSGHGGRIRTLLNK